ncbi:MAG: glycosyltransferase family 2 protein [Muribaculaceae bacterium]|nr:glycosyltransferase family 2 protein [Muribaculaceae bacterium]
MNQPTVTAIVPVYNASEGLRRCIGSVESQTFEDWELLLIDDGSTDDSLEICNEYASSDSRIKVIHKENGGVSSARNVGIENARGEYIAFIDADDYIDSEFFSKMLAGTPADLVVCGFDITGARPFIPSCQVNNEKITPELAKELVEIPFYLDSPWAKLLKARIIKDNGLRFDRNLKLSEDTLFSYQYLVLANTVTIIPATLYYYEGSWGGGVAKYSMSEKELRYMSSVLTSAVKNINRAHKTELDIKYKGWHQGKLKNLYTDFKDVDLYNIYTESHGPMPIEEFLGDKDISPLSYAFTLGLRKCENEGQQSCVSHLQNVKRFITTPLGYIKFQSLRHKILHTILKLFGARSASGYLYIYMKLSHAKNRICKSTR